jgi:hypothetical protein
LPKSPVAHGRQHLHLHKEEAVDAVVLAPESDRRDALLHLADLTLYTKRNQRKKVRKRKKKSFSTMILRRKKRTISLMSQRSWSPLLPRVGAAILLGDQHLALVLPETPPPLDLLAGNNLLHRVVLQHLVVSRKRTKRTFAVPPQGLVPLVANRLEAETVGVDLPVEAVGVNPPTEVHLPAETTGVALLVDRAL